MWKRDAKEEKLAFKRERKRAKVSLEAIDEIEGIDEPALANAEGSSFGDWNSIIRQSREKINAQTAAMDKAWKEEEAKGHERPEN